MCGMIHTYENTIHIRLLGDVCLILKSSLSLPFVMLMLAKVILDLRE